MLTVLLMRKQSSVELMFLDYSYLKIKIEKIIYLSFTN